MTTILLVLGAIAPLTFAVLFGIGALVGVVGEVAHLRRRHAWLRQQAPPRAGEQVARFDAHSARAGATLHDQSPAATDAMSLGTQIDPATKASGTTLRAERRDTEKLRDLLRKLEEESQPGHRRRQTVLAIRGFSVDDIDFGLWHRD